MGWWKIFGFTVKMLKVTAYTAICMNSSDTVHLCGSLSALEIFRDLLEIFFLEIFVCSKRSLAEKKWYRRIVKIGRKLRRSSVQSPAQNRSPSSYHLTQAFSQSGLESLSVQSLSGHFAPMLVCHGVKVLPYIQSPMFQLMPVISYSPTSYHCQAWLFWLPW